MIVVMIGGSIGAISRYLLSKWLLRIVASPIPTLCINVVGSCLLGFILQSDITHSYTLILATGFLGAFTTFSTYSYEAFTLLREKKYTKGLLYILASIICSLLGVYIGLTL